MPQGLISKGIGGFYYVFYEDKVIECKVRGKFRNISVKPIVGDYVEFELVDREHGVINNILDRKNEIARPTVSNIDQVLLVLSIVHPEPNLLFVDKLITYLESMNIDMVICINKIDLDLEEIYQDVKKIYQDAGYKVINVSAKKMINLSLLEEVIQGKVSTIAGMSGVGKSTMINSLLGLNLETGTLSKKVERGKHTTRHVELFKLKNGYIFDTPGFSQFELNSIRVEQLKGYFKEFGKYSNCKFAGCNHINEPDCGVKEAVDAGNISISRYENYKIIFDEIKSINRYK